MKRSSVGYYRCPADLSALELTGAPAGERVDAGTLVSAAGHLYPIVSGVPHIVYPETLSVVEEHTQSDYDRAAERVYDVAMNWQFAAFLENEDAVREGMLDLLDVKVGDRVSRSAAAPAGTPTGWRGDSVRAAPCSCRISRT